MKKGREIDRYLIENYIRGTTLSRLRYRLQASLKHLFIFVKI